MNGTTTCSYFATLHLEASKVRKVTKGGGEGLGVCMCVCV
jgi:hypothetical protein